ncbi:hypothetical protein [EBPR siphovirus 2]|nr:hypothetical protein [EBPR siphovirus 2]
MADQPLHMWSYWADKYGPVEAFRDYYPDTARKNPVISYSLQMLSVATIAIEAEMTRLLKENEGGDDD